MRKSLFKIYEERGIIMDSKTRSLDPTRRPTEREVRRIRFLHDMGLWDAQIAFFLNLNWNKVRAITKGATHKTGDVYPTPDMAVTFCYNEVYNLHLSWRYKNGN